MYCQELVLSYVVTSNLVCTVLLCLGNSVCSSRECNFLCEHCWSCVVTCKLLCVMYVDVVKCVGVGGV